MVNKLAEELFTAAVTDIRVLATSGADGDVQRTRDAEDAGQTEELDGLNVHCSMLLQSYFFEKKAASKTDASTWCQLSWCLNLVPKLSGAKMISYKLTEYQRIML